MDSFTAASTLLDDAQGRCDRAFRGLTLKGSKIGVYQHTTVARKILITILQKAGADIIALK
jgi:hypothetical protein